MAIPHDAPVVDRDGNEVAQVEALLGDDEEGIFHGLAINLPGWGGHVELPADRIQRITTLRVYTDLAPGESETLDELEPDKWFEFEGRGRFRKRVKWRKDD
jgi:hypothetical protein